MVYHKRMGYNKKIRPKCSVSACSNLNFSLSYCDKHYRGYKRHGSAEHINPKCNRDGKYKERARAKTAQWKKNNRVTYNAYLASRKTRVRQATPKWSNLAAVRAFYLKCPPGHHVDHIIPINGKNVSGLHIIENLQYLPAAINLQKSNKF